MRNNYSKQKNRGYTLIEAIIVIAIMAILSGASFVTIGIIRRAKCSAAASTLNAQMGSLLVKTKALSEAQGDCLCMLIRYNDSDVTYADGTLAKAGSYSLILGYDNGGTVTERTANTAEATLPNILKIEYEPQAGSAYGCNYLDGTAQIKEAVVEFNKANGSVRYGAGKYNIVYGNNTVATVSLDASTGNHFVK